MGGDMGIPSPLREGLGGALPPSQIYFNFWVSNQCSRKRVQQLKKSKKS